MADAVTTQVLYDGQAEACIKFTNISDGTGEAAVTKVDVSTLAVGLNGSAPTGVLIEEVYAATAGMGVDILWGADTDVLALHIPADQLHELCFDEYAIANNAGTGKTGDIKFTTVGHSAGDRYTIILRLRKKYD